jgi:formylglycine-generating enzyme required for sulfatase activity
MHPEPGEPEDGRDYPFLAPPQEADELGRLGRYRVLRELGRGGMGVVFVAEDPRLQRLVALKVMKPEAAARPDARTRFLREALSTAQVPHDHIVPIYDSGEDNGSPFLVMPLLQGQTLEDRLRHGPPPLAEALRIAREIAEGLAAAHEKGLIHRDVKPGNVWLEKEPPDRVKVLDFGLARLVEADAQLTASRALLGTPAYMAPEQAAGSKDVDGRADLFSLGAILYEMLTGRRAFLGKGLMALANRLLQPPPPPHVLSPEVPGAVSALVMRLLAEDREERPASAASVARLLRALEAVPAQVLPPDTVPPRPPASTAEHFPEPEPTTDLPAATSTYLPERPGLAWWARLVIVGGLLLPVLLALLPALRHGNQAHDDTPTAAPRAAPSPAESALAFAEALHSTTEADLALRPTLAFAEALQTTTEVNLAGLVFAREMHAATEGNLAGDHAGRFAAALHEAATGQLALGQRDRAAGLTGLAFAAALHRATADRLTERRLARDLGRVALVFADALHGAMHEDAVRSLQRGADGPAFAAALWASTRASLALRQQTREAGHVALAFAAALASVVEAPPSFTNSIGIRMIRIEPGTYLMSSPDGEKGRRGNEPPQRRVTFDRAFYVSECKITQEQYRRLLGESPLLRDNPFWFSAEGKGRDAVKGLVTRSYPAEMVSFPEARESCVRLSAQPKEGDRVYRLPTEAEWEYVCRAGSTTAYSFGDDPRRLGDHAWFAGNAEERPRPVRQKRPNAWGLYDMHGNVWEWCLSGSGEDGRPPVLRGGAWNSSAQDCRTAFRLECDLGSRSRDAGFRIVCDAPEPRKGR